MSVRLRRSDGHHARRADIGGKVSHCSFGVATKDARPHGASVLAVAIIAIMMQA